MILIRLPEVLKMVPVSKTKWYAMIKANDAPRPVGLGPRSVAWVKEDIEKWIEGKAAARKLAS
jgi:prophage regulatory protein